MKLYVIGPAEGPYKVGIASDVNSRLSSLQVSTYQRLVIHADAEIGDAADALKVEAQVHAKLESYHLSGEWFGCSLEQVMGASPVKLEPRVDMSAVKADAYRILFALAEGVPPEMRHMLAAQVGSKTDAPADIAQARIDVLFPKGG